MTESDSPGWVVVEDADRVDMVEEGCAEEGCEEGKDGGEEVAADSVDEGAGELEVEVVVDSVEEGLGVEGTESSAVGAAVVGVVILVASTLVTAGAPILEGRAEENGLEPGVS